MYTKSLPLTVSHPMDGTLDMNPVGLSRDAVARTLTSFQYVLSPERL
jgi:hypothetical protein